ncbi:hypothetical protein M5362_11610 [Streptomyces sp. Je 1-79]|uniref:hypothetical protein n=1 Tax=Streptomyces sp. Je 1-79 TaxID=2943847 RepID=UPI0021A72F4A|nr:hypothetical protein [Streptomyces sp. Je 1-79]MCT4353774.1 hypothetical protein [Streptomyces sp. Je 1-79]
MLLSHHIDAGTLRVTLKQDLDVTNRAAAALLLQALVDAHRPAAVVLELPAGPLTAATMSAVARARRMCDSLSVPLTLVHGPAEPVTGSREPLAYGAVSEA